MQPCSCACFVVERTSSLGWFEWCKPYGFHHLYRDLRGGWTHTMARHPTTVPFFVAFFFPWYMGQKMTRQLFFYSSRCKVYSTYMTWILSSAQALSMLCYSSWLKKASLPPTHVGGCTIENRIYFLTLPRTNSEKKNLRKSLVTEETRLSRNPLFILHILNTERSIPLQVLQSRMGDTQ